MVLGCFKLYFKVCFLYQSFVLLIVLTTIFITIHYRPIKSCLIYKTCLNTTYFSYIKVVFCHYL